MGPTRKTIRTCLCLTFCLGISAPVLAQNPSSDADKERAKRAQLASKVSNIHPPDRSGKPQRGKASYYHDKFAGRKMADGTKMDPNSNIAASKTLPLGTKAVVTNLENGKSEVVEIRDRGPYVDGRIIDLTPKTAEELGITHQGLARVEVTPIEVPLPDGSVKRGAAQTNVAGNATENASGR